jgi:hypothetical protein
LWMAGVVRETWQRLLGWLVSAAKREAPFFICLLVRLSAVDVPWYVVVSHLRGGSEYAGWRTRDCCMRCTCHSCMYMYIHRHSNTITHSNQDCLLISCAQYGDIGELLSTGAHTTDNTSRPHLTSSRRAGLTRVISGGCASRLWHSCGWQAQPSTQAPVTNIPDSVSAVCTEPHLTSPLPYHLPSAADDYTPRPPPPLSSSPPPSHPPPTTICSITTPEAVAGHVLHPSP